MSTAQIKTNYFKTFVVSCALHLVLLCPFFLFNEVISQEPSAISVNLLHSPSPVAAKGGKTKQITTKQGHQRSGVPNAHSTLEVESPGPAWSANASHQDSPSLSLARNATPKEIQKPRFTARALSKGIEGEVVLVVNVSEDGEVKHADIRKSLGYGLDEASLEAIYKSKFEPARNSEGKPIDDVLTYRFKFEIVNSKT